MNPQDKYYTELDMDLQRLALTDWPTFVLLVGEDNIAAAKVLTLKSRGKSYTQIANKLKISRDKVIYACKKVGKPPTEK